MHVLEEGQGAFLLNPYWQSTSRMQTPHGVSKRKATLSGLGSNCDAQGDFRKQ